MVRGRLWMGRGAGGGSVPRGRLSRGRGARGEFWASLFYLAVAASRAAALAAQDSVASTLGLACAFYLQLTPRRALRCPLFDLAPNLLATGRDILAKVGPPSRCSEDVDAVATRGDDGGRAAAVLITGEWA